ncbi:claudin-10 isoform X3 [Ictalurus furcatus]|uniref:claudin-10 isoform X3 n=1 Tax=Ictalurus furcatus TaxID=66913 RepID=UPI0023501DF6|nr:claudin-10 isoform X3 [Ictalurus furcatus]
MSRTAVMYIEIGCLLCCICGWILICSTLPTEYWNFSEVGDAVLTTVNYYSNLWMDCTSDTTGVSDCKYYPSMMALPVFLHVCRALAIGSVILGFWGAVLTFIGMKCTKIGGSELVNARIKLAAAFTYIASGVSGMAVYSMWANRIRAEFVDANFKPQKSNDTLLQADDYTRARSRGTYVTARTRGTYMLSAYSKPTTAIMPPLFHSGRESKGTRRTQKTYRTRKTTASMQFNMDSYV